MQAAIKLKTRVLPGKRIEFTSPELLEGEEVEVVVALPGEAWSGSNERENFEQRFAVLAARWYAETAVLSSITQKAMHPAYQEIIGLGRDVVPFILRELQMRPDHWFWALRAITGENPIRPEQQGRVREMAAAWIQWGHERGVIA